MPSVPSAVKKTAAKIPNNYAAAREEGRGSAELLILPDGRILAHNITPAMAALLAELAPDDPDMRRRADALSTPPSATASRSQAPAISIRP